MIKIIDHFIIDTETDLATALDLAEGKRHAYVQLRMETFSSCQWNWERLILFAYDGLNFNIAPPPLEQYRLTLYDAIGNCADDGKYKLDPSLDSLPNGMQLSEFRTYWPGTLPDCADFYRPSWQCLLPWPGQAVMHPQECRELQGHEWAIVLSSTLHTWIDYQVALFNADHWKDKDYQSTYDGEQWVGEAMPGASVKVFDLREYRPRESYPHKLPHKYFNLDSNGKIIYSWDAIQEHKRKYV